MAILMIIVKDIYKRTCHDLNFTIIDDPDGDTVMGEGSPSSGLSEGIPSSQPHNPSNGLRMLGMFITHSFGNFSHYIT